MPTCEGPLRHKRAGPRFAHRAEAPFRLSPFTRFTLPPRSARLVPRLALHYSKVRVARIRAIGGECRARLSCCRAKRGFEREGVPPAVPREVFCVQKLYTATFCSVSRRCKVGGSPGGTRRRRGHMRDARRAASLRATCAKGWREAYAVHQGTEQRPERTSGSRKEEHSAIADVQGPAKA